MIYLFFPGENVVIYIDLLYMSKKYIYTTFTKCGYMGITYSFIFGLNVSLKKN